MKPSVCCMVFESQCNRLGCKHHSALVNKSNSLDAGISVEIIDFVIKLTFLKKWF